MNWGVNSAGPKKEVLYLKEKYGNPKIYVTKNGCAKPDWPDQNGFVADHGCINFLRAHLQALHTAIDEGANALGYFVWDVLDNFEWVRGCDPRFGQVCVAYETLTRIPKQSAWWYRYVGSSNSILI